MQIWHHHPRSGELIAAGVADPDPLAEGAWLIPAFATAIAPPPTAPGTVAVFDVGAWSLVADHRGETWWSAAGDPVIITALGDPSDLGLLAEQPTPGAADPATLPLLSRRQVLFGLFEDGFVTLAEFEASATAVPASIAAIIGAAPGFDDAAKAREKVRFLTMEYARRDHPLTLMLQASRPSMTDGEVDAMWLRWAAL